MSRRNLAYDAPDPDTRGSEGPPSGLRSTTNDLAEQVNTLEQSLRNELNVFVRPGRVQTQDSSRRHLSSMRFCTAFVFDVFNSVTLTFTFNMNRK